MEIVHFHGDNGEWLQLSAGKPSHDLLKLAKSGLAFELRNILHKAKREKKPVVRENIPLKVNGNQCLVSFEVITLPNVVDRYYLILFRNTTTITKAPAKGHKKTSTSKLNNEEDMRIEQLERELAQVREDMRSITEDQEATNEELQSANEELQSGSEELQSLNEEIETSKEELQSTNEELTVVNQELVALNAQITEERNYANSIISTVRGPLVVLDKNLKVKSANNSFYKTFLVNEHETEGKLFYDLGNHQWDIPELRMLLEAVLPKKENIYDFEITTAFPSIGERTMLVNAKEIIKEGGTEKLVLVAIEDITERIRAAAESSMLLAVVSSSADAIVAKTLDGIITSWNKGAEKMFGYSALEVIGKNISIIVPAELQTEEETVIKRIRNGEQIFHFDTVRIAKDGRRIDISLAVSPIKDKQRNIIGASKISRDITKQKQAEAVLRNNEERFRELVKHLPAAVYACDSEGQITFYNDSAVKVWGRTPEIGKDKWCGSWKMVKEDGSLLPHESCPMAIAFKEGRAILGEEVWVERPDGTRSIVQVYPQPLFSLSGEKTGAINMVIDVTEQKEAAKRIRESEENFHQLAELTPEKVSAADAQGKLIYFNQRWRDYTGLNFNELRNLKLNEFIHADDKQEFASRWAHSLATGNDLEMEIVCETAAVSTSGTSVIWLP
ncbi:MAG TPA: PAS domain S-box protein [Chryseolinea sp.]|nr:PAS domain S-box protein [Chryseolinea sp.]